jgi:radical SAM/Cys-rich protein
LKFKEALKEEGAYPLRSVGIEILQVNLGYKCNMACKHCHVEAGPARNEVMDKSMVDAVIKALKSSPIRTLDITGGAPELNPHFTYLIAQSKEAGKHVIVRSNLTIFYENGMNGLPEFYRENSVEVIASLPYYMEENVDRIRGKGAFRKSIDALRTLNELGYGNNSGLNLNLVYNPQGAFLPSSQSSIEDEYKIELKDKHDIEFNNLYTFTNMPIGRFKNFLVKSENLDKYMTTLTSSFNPETLNGIMCRHLVSVGWDGTLYDCDFNQVVGLNIVDVYPQNIAEFDLDELSKREIAIDDHCFGCTAGQGST